MHIVYKMDRNEQNPELSAMFAAEQATCQVILNQFYNGPKFRNYH